PSLTDVLSCLRTVEAAVLDGDALLETEVGGIREQANARLWRGQVLVDWEPDPQAGGCLLRPELLRRLLDLRAVFTCSAEGLIVRAAGRVVTALSPHHADLVGRLGGPRKVELEARLRFKDEQYRGG